MSQLKLNQITDAEITDSSWKSLYKVGGVAALILGILFLTAAVSLIVLILWPGIINGWFKLIQNNWLILLFKINANLNGAHTGLLYKLNLLDIAIMALVATMFLGLYVALQKISKIWVIIAVVQPFIGIALFIITKISGRCGILSAVMVISFVMLGSNNFNKVTAIIGILVSGLLIACDAFTTDDPSIMIAILIAIGYAFLMTWFFLIGQRLFQLGNYERKTLT